MNVDRIFRRMIEHANNNGDCIVNIGDGVFRPIPGDPVDEKAFHEYIGKELHRARAIQYKRLCMKQTFESWKKIGKDYMHYILMVKGKLNNMNDYIRALNTNRYKGADMKKDNESRVMQAIYEQFGRLRITRKVRMHYRWYEPDKRRDLDNVSAFGRKCIQDALVDTKVLQDDGWKNIVGFTDEFYVDKKNPRIEVDIEEV